jgi:hypothetical protein
VYDVAYRGAAMVRWTIGARHQIVMCIWNRSMERAINGGELDSKDATAACVTAMLLQTISASGHDVTCLYPGGLDDPAEATDTSPGREDHHARLHHAAMGH